MVLLLLQLKSGYGVRVGREVMTPIRARRGGGDVGGGGGRVETPDSLRAGGRPASNDTLSLIFLDTLPETRYFRRINFPPRGSVSVRVRRDPSKDAAGRRVKACCVADGCHRVFQA